ncbi:MAG: hypothetical protein RLZZ15_2588, partial [Verrucomicrobiota bacterium]
MIFPLGNFPRCTARCAPARCAHAHAHASAHAFSRSFTRARVLALAATLTLTLTLAAAVAPSAVGAEPARTSPLATHPRYTGSPFVRTWLAEDYGAHPVNSSLLQHPRTGLIYVGNTSGILEFDGERWRLIRTPAGAGATSLRLDDRGRIWACAGADIIRLEPDARGELQARSMRGRMEATAKLADRFNECVATSAGLYAIDRLRLWLLPADDGPAQVWRLSETNATLLKLWAEDDDPWVLLGERPIVVARLHAGKIDRPPVPARRVHEVRTEPDGTKHYLTRATLDRWHGASGHSVRLPLTNDTAYAAIFLADGRIAFGTDSNGLIVCDRDGRFLQRIDRTDGLPANGINGLMEDREGGVWLAMHLGLARVQLDSPYARHGPAQGLEGTVHSLARHGDRLYLATTEGLAARGPEGEFEGVPGVRGWQREVAAHGEWLFALSSYAVGFRLGETGKPHRLETRNYLGVVPLAAWPGWFALGASDGLRWGRFEGDKWVGKGPLHAPAPRVVTRALLEAPAGIVWATFAGEGLWRADLRNGLRADAPARRFSLEDGLPQPPSAMFLLGGEIVAAAAGQLLRFDAAAARFTPDARIAGLAPQAVERAYADHAGTIWIQGPAPARAISRLVAEGAGRWRVEPLPGEPLRHLPPT